MTVFDFSSYHAYFAHYLSQQPKKGHGLLSQWAKELRVSTTLLSQVMAGKKTLGLEIALGLAEILKLTQKETDHLLLLAEHERAGTAKLRQHFRRKIEDSSQASRLMKNRVAPTPELTSEVKAQYYASWVYSGLRNRLACDAVASVDDLAAGLKISRAAVLEAIEFLSRHGLIVAVGKGWTWGPQSTFLPADSPLVRKHHQNWRIKAIQRMDENLEEDLFYTSPMSLSESVAKQLRRRLVELIEELHRAAEPSPSEGVRCLNIDWFEF